MSNNKSIEIKIDHYILEYCFQSLLSWNLNYIDIFSSYKVDIYEKEISKYEYYLNIKITTKWIRKVQSIKNYIKYLWNKNIKYSNAYII